MKELFGILAAIIGISAVIPYVYSILKKKTRPHRISWAIWSIISIVTLTSYLAKGAHWSSLLIFAAVFNNALIFILSFKYGTGGTTRFDKVCFGISIFGVVMWLISGEAIYGLLFAILADSMGTFLTAKKSYIKPFSESALTWSMATFASLLGLLAVQTYTFAQTIYPIYALLGGLILASITIIRRYQIVQNNN